MKVNKKCFYSSICLIIVFVAWTALVCLVDVEAIGPNGSTVGFATFNGFVHSITGCNMLLYTITDWLGLVPIVTAMCFAVLGLVQWIKRKNPLRVDYSILALGVFYIIVITVYVFFEFAVINYRPVLINGYLEASYPSSTTILVISVMITAIMQLRQRIKGRALMRFTEAVIVAFIMFMVIGRILSGVHWITDIIGGALLSFGLVGMYGSICNMHLR